MKEQLKITKLPSDEIRSCNQCGDRNPYKATVNTGAPIANAVYHVDTASIQLALCDKCLMELRDMINTEFER